MTTFRDKLKKICNYSENNTLMLPTAQLMYIDNVVEDNGELKREIKRKKRNLAIDTVLDEIEENGDYSESNVFGSGYESGGKVEVMSLSVSRRNYLTDKDIYTEVVNFLEVNSKQKHSIPVSLDYIATNNPHNSIDENIQINFKKIVTKIFYASNHILYEGRNGQGTAVIVGKNNWHWFTEDVINGLSVILDDNISPDKIIVCRGGLINNIGLILVDNVSENRYYFKETTNWNKQYVWFNVK